MARDFNGTSNFMSTANAVISGYPLTMAAWFNSDGITANQAILCVGTNGSDNHLFALIAAGGAGGDPIRFRAKDTGGSNANTSIAFSANTWQHACGVGVSATDRSAFINGGSEGTSTVSRTPSGMDKTAIAIRIQATEDNFFNGEIAEAAIWNVALTNAEVALLAQPVSPLLIRPEALVAYWPLIRGTGDRVGGFTLSSSAALVTAHPRIFYPGRPFVGVPTAAVAGVTLPIFDKHYRSMRAA